VAHPELEALLRHKWLTRFVAVLALHLLRTVFELIIAECNVVLVTAAWDANILLILAI